MIDNLGRFSCEIPLSHIFEFCRNIRNVIYGASYTVALMRKSAENEALRRGANPNANGNVELTRLTLWMPIMTPSLSVETRLLSFMRHGGKSLISWSDVMTDITTSNNAGVFTWQLALTKK